MTIQEALKVIERYSYVNEPTQDDMQNDFDEAFRVLTEFVKLHIAADNLDFGRDYIDQVASLGYIQPLNYDTLRAIAFELNQNYSLADSLSVLNILATSRELNFEITLTSTTGETLVKESFGEYNIEGSISLRENTFLHVNGGYIGFHYEDFDIKGDPTPDGFFLIDEESMRSGIIYAVDSRSEEYKSLTKSEQEDFAKAIQGFKNGSMKVRIIPAPTMHIKL